MNTQNASVIAPGPECARFEPVLPVLDTGELGEREAEQVSAHVAGCAWCQARLHEYALVDAAVRRYLESSTPSTPVFSREQVMGMAEDAAPSTVPHPLRLLDQPPRPQNVVSGLAGLAAVLLIAVLALATFSAHGPGRGVNPAPSATVSPLLAEKTVYVAGSGVYALRASDGKLLWTYPRGDPRAWTGHVSGMILVDGTLYFDGGAGTSSFDPATPATWIRAIKASNGSALWSVRIPAEPGETLVASQGVIYAVPSLYSFPNEPDVEGSHVVYALRASDGAVIWHVRVPEPLLSAAAAGRGALYVASRTHVYALRTSDGKLLWSSPLGYALVPPEDVGQLEGYTNQGVTGEALAATQDVLVVNVKVEFQSAIAQRTKFTAHTCVFSPRDGTPLWCGEGAPSQDSAAAYPPVVSDGILYTQMGGTLSGVRATSRTLALVWLLNHGNPLVGPAVVDGVAYASDYLPIVLDGKPGSSTYTYAFRVGDGSPLWHTETNSGTMSLPPTVADGVVFAGGATQVFALRAADGKVLWHYITPTADLLSASPLVGS